ncbi:Permease of the drug/metabolite transporter (DMT) superfamily [Polaromonas sp. CG9_12]|nr:Permease of the drug/metabolite transporter (DMT) superfamily [Polaromonas sp. CG9_12]
MAVISIIFSVAAQFALKAGMTEIKAAAPSSGPHGIQMLLPFVTNKYLITGFMLYGLGAIVWLGVLSKWDVSKAYPLVGLGFLLSALVGFALGESVTLIRGLGVLMIIAGVLMVGMS